MKSILILLGIAIALVACRPVKDEDSVDNDRKVVRKGAMIMVKPEKLEFYKKLHANPWDGVNNTLKEYHIQNYSIYYREGYLFSYMEYTGSNWEKDMKALAADSTIQEWWRLTDPCQEPVPFAKDGEWWADMEEIYHLE